MGRLTPIDGFMTIPQYGCTVYNPTFDHDTSTSQWRVYKWCDLGMRDSSGMTSQRVQYDLLMQVEWSCVSFL